MGILKEGDKKMIALFKNIAKDVKIIMFTQEM